MSDYLDEALASRARTRMKRHLGECDECRRLLAGLRLVVDELHRLPTLGGSRDGLRIAASVRAKLGERAEP